MSSMDLDTRRARLASGLIGLIAAPLSVNHCEPASSCGGHEISTNVLFVPPLRKYGRSCHFPAHMPSWPNALSFNRAQSCRPLGREEVRPVRAALKRAPLESERLSHFALKLFNQPFVELHDLFDC
jgi:hypothetical protein